MASVHAIRAFVVQLLTAPRPPQRALALLLDPVCGKLQSEQASSQEFPGRLPGLHSYELPLICISLPSKGLRTSNEEEWLHKLQTGALVPPLLAWFARQLVMSVTYIYIYMYGICHTSFDLSEIV